MNIRPHLPDGFPKVVCLCGSTRFPETYIKANRDETLAGNIVLSVGMFGHQEGIDMGGMVKAGLDQLHLRKIDLADEVLVLNPNAVKCLACGSVLSCENSMFAVCPCGQSVEGCTPKPYVGESTMREIAHAVWTGKPIRFLNPE